jgi:predicted phage terminase large subunit-like protein
VAIDPTEVEQPDPLALRPDRTDYWLDRVATMTEEEATVLLRLLSPKLTRYIPHAPTPPQAAFLSLDAKEALYGGAAGGGKSEALLMGALQHVDDPASNAILFRRTYGELALPGALLDRAHQWLQGTDAHWNGNEYQWTFPSGATINFSYLQHEVDKYRYQSADFTYIAFDELTAFQESQYTYLFSRLRRAEGVSIPLRMRGATNPGGVGHEWVLQRFMVEGPGAGRVFVPARLADNPHLDQEAYMESLAELGEVDRRRLADGDWRVRPLGTMFRRHKVEVVEPDDLPTIVRMVRWWDLASTEQSKDASDPDWTAGVLMGITSSLQYVVLDVVRARLGPAEVETLIETTTRADGRQVQVFMEQEPGSSGKNTIAYYTKLLRGFSFKGIRSTGTKEERARPWSGQWMAGGKGERGNVKIKRAPWNSIYLEEHEVFGQPGVHDDQVDASSGAFSQLALGKRRTARAYG